jgi:hypothetical protein
MTMCKNAANTLNMKFRLSINNQIIVWTKVNKQVIYSRLRLF